MGVFRKFAQMGAQMAANGLVCICAFICVHLWSVLIHEFTQMVTQMVANGLVCISALICEHLWKRLCEHLWKRPLWIVSPKSSFK
jgi:adenylylsulfate kinase-like enzyme